MGAVHGVYLKYMSLSALSGYGYWRAMSRVTVDLDFLALLNSNNNNNNNNATNDRLLLLAAAVCGYSTLLNGSISIGFYLKRGMGLIGKDRDSGQIPLWSYVLFAPFHIPTWLYTFISHKIDKYPAASLVQDGWYVGGRYAHELSFPTRWAAVVDVTSEFPESCRDRTARYLSLPAWDGVPASPADLERAAEFCVAARRARPDLPVLVHCAHGKGRSTTVMVACLVKAGKFPDWETAFARGIKPYRPCCKLNDLMKTNLAAWQKEYVDNKRD